MRARTLTTLSTTTVILVGLVIGATKMMQSVYEWSADQAKQQENKDIELLLLSARSQRMERINEAWNNRYDRPSISPHEIFAESSTSDNTSPAPKKRPEGSILKDGSPSNKTSAKTKKVSFADKPVILNSEEQSPSAMKPGLG